jgi:hypothetical protein
MQTGRQLLPSLSPHEDRCVTSRFFLVNLMVSSQANLRGWSLKGAQATRLSNTVIHTLFWVLCICWCQLTLGLQELEYYDTSSGVSAALDSRLISPF